MRIEIKICTVRNNGMPEKIKATNIVEMITYMETDNGIC
jgi:hypothetical protein